MAFRSKEAIAACIVAAAAWSAPLEFNVRHKHLYGGGAGVLSFDDNAVVFTESGKKDEHSRKWAYEDIQQLTIGESSIEVLTFRDRAWQLGRDVEYRFEKAPAGVAAAVYPMLSRKLDQRLVVAAPIAPSEALWRIPVKLRRRTGGSEGVLIAAADRLVYESRERGESRTWRLEDIENISAPSPAELTITTAERSGLLRGGDAEFRFQLKRRLSEQQYDALWRRVNRGKGLRILATQDRVQ